MRNSRGIVWGGLLVLLGTFWLLRNMDLIHIDWSSVLPYWPALLILAGIVLLVTRRDGGFSGGFVALCITLAVFGGIVNRTDRAFDRDNWNFKWDDDHDSWDRNDEDDEEEDNDEEENNSDKDEQYLNERGDGKKAIKGSYQYEMEDFIQKANFNLEGGAGSFTVDGNTTKLYEANTQSSLVGFLSNTSINKLDNSATVNLKMEEGNVKINKGKISNEAKIHLNEKPIWNIDLGIGAGKGDFDFSNYRVEKLKVSTGVADMDIRLGDKMANTDVNIEAGVASITLQVPKSVGCEMHMDGALNSRNFDGLDRVSDNLYRSPGFASAEKKIIVHYQGGLTSFKIRRY
ncbi:LiaF transmembrane domain-containing protein [Dyadobacter psychrotolerans]|uniref:LiaF transmembrane domain-containing protein n=1 Tax=Dyadobacter psychrotolerans TaxID=2541721 RepID=A0A4R5DQF6_9BACT|nr:DUF5668 domain-containing protein [Dyadobacter psychrotolerans]TDE16606.1 hypothetical protein E0F88_10250 [Dyadobacter psychrotolerans]